jgi:protein phosphatase 2C
LFVQVANYCANRMHVVLKEALGRAARAGLEESGELLDITELWQKVFGGCFQRVDDEVSGQASRLCGGVSSEAQCKPVAAGDVGSTAAVAVVCSSHIIVANCGDSRVVLSRGKEPVPLSDDHKVHSTPSVFSQAALSNGEPCLTCFDFFYFYF